jgi:hypothetical protein
VWNQFRALPAYFGGKRRLVRLIFAALNTVVPRPKWSGLRFVDPFLGGGSVSLFAKAQGFRVACNDLAFRSALVGHGARDGRCWKKSPYWGTPTANEGPCKSSPHAQRGRRLTPGASADMMPFVGVGAIVGSSSLRLEPSAEETENRW